MSRAIDILSLVVDDCPRCTGRHGVSVKRFAVALPPVRVGDPAAPQELQTMRFTYWALCPKLGEPILMTDDVVPQLTRGIACAR